MSQQAVLSASYRGRMIHFTDLVREGDHVEVHRTLEEAGDDRGPRISCVVRRTRDDWWLEELSRSLDDLRGIGLPDPSDFPDPTLEP